MPEAAPSSTSPLSSTSSHCTPGSGRVAEPGFSATAPGVGEIKIPPVSVCHQVSTMGQRPSPTTRWYQSHASGLIGSPTEPKQAQGRAGSGFPHGRLALAHQGADGGGGGVEDLHLVLVDHLPEPRGVRDSWARPRTSGWSRRSPAGRRRCSCARSPIPRQQCTRRFRPPCLKKGAGSRTPVRGCRRPRTDTPPWCASTPLGFPVEPEV